MFGTIADGPEASEAYFNKWVEEVKATVPKERLLVFEAKQGWKPLCEFLGLPVPDGPFPRVNDTPAMLRSLRMLKIIGYTTVYGLPILLAVLLFVYLFGSF